MKLHYPGVTYHRLCSAAYCILLPWSNTGLTPVLKLIKYRLLFNYMLFLPHFVHYMWSFDTNVKLYVDLCFESHPIHWFLVAAEIWPSVTVCGFYSSLFPSVWVNAEQTQASTWGKSCTLSKQKPTSTLQSVCPSMRTNLDFFSV